MYRCACWLWCTNVCMMYSCICWLRWGRRGVRRLVQWDGRLFGWLRPGDQMDALSVRQVGHSAWPQSSGDVRLKFVTVIKIEVITMIGLPWIKGILPLVKLFAHFLIQKETTKFSARTNVCYQLIFDYGAKFSTYYIASHLHKHLCY